ncbi:MAG TPA: FecR domain-containing protein [Parasegetibacter sp.]
MDRIQLLLLKYLREELSEEELQELNAWAAQSAENKELFGQISNPDFMAEQLKRMEQFSEDRVREKMDAYAGANSGGGMNLSPDAIPDTTGNKSFFRRYFIGIAVGTWAAAACLAILIGLGAYMWLSLRIEEETGKQGGQLAGSVLKNDIQPGIDGAVLTLANGQQIVLDTASPGIIAAEAGAELELKQGQLSYNIAGVEAGSGAAEGEVQWHMLTTPKGRQFNLRLPDGSRVWLNAASSIRFPVTFNNKERRVVVTGEAFFEVVPVFANLNTASGPISASKVSNHQKVPFIVSTSRQEIEVLGTQVNINAYDDEDFEKTTLLTGSVKVTSKMNAAENNASTADKAGVMLVPGQQVAVASDGKLGQIRNVQTDQVIAWKNGYFLFESNTIAFIMKQASRWYDVEVVYEGNPPLEKLSGEIPRTVPLSQFLEMLQFTGIRFAVEGQRIIVKGKAE